MLIMSTSDESQLINNIKIHIIIDLDFKYFYMELNIKYNSYFI